MRLWRGRNRDTFAAGKRAPRRGAPTKAARQIRRAAAGGAKKARLAKGQVAQLATWQSGLFDRFEALLAAHVRAKDLGNRHRAVCVQVLLEESDDEARKRNARAVKRVDELRLAVGVFEAAV